MSIPFVDKVGGNHFVGRRTLLTSMPSRSIDSCAPITRLAHVCHPARLYQIVSASRSRVADTVEARRQLDAECGANGPGDAGASDAGASDAGGASASGPDASSNALEAGSR